MSRWVRKIHRWLAIVFTATVIIAFVGVTQPDLAWLYYLPLAPLALMLITGLYLFVLPYVGKRRRGQNSGGLEITDVRAG